MADKIVQIAKDATKEALRQDKARPTVTPQETKAILDRILTLLGVD